MLTRKEGAVTYTQTWDEENRLKSVSGNNHSVTYTYDADGQRVKKVEDGQTTVYFGKSYEKNVTANTVTTYYYAGGQRVAQRQGEVSYFVGDNLGSTSLTTDANGAEVGRQTYYPFGAPRLQGVLRTDYRFTGQRSEEDSFGSLYDYGARFYSPILGRFISPDTVIPDMANPQSLNRYTYVLNQPLVLIDPSGHANCAAADRACWENEWYWKDRWYKEHGYENAGNDHYVFTGKFIIPNAIALLGDANQRRMAIKNFTQDLANNHTGAGEALARVTAYAAALYASVALLTPLLVNQYVDDVSHVLTGMAGPDIVIDQKNQSENTDSYFVGQDHFPGTDLLGIYQDGTSNQAYHFWFYVALTAWNGPLVASAGNLFHELTGDPAGRSMQDLALGAAGIDLGRELSSRRLSIFGVSGWIRRNLMR